MGALASAPENIEHAGLLAAQLLVEVDRLAAAAGAAAGAGHDLHEVIVHLAALGCACISLRALPRPLTTATRTMCPCRGYRSRPPSRLPSMPRTAVKASGVGILAGQTGNKRVRRAASMTPPVAPKMHGRAGAGAQRGCRTPLPPGRSRGRYARLRIMRSSSRVVRTMSTSGSPPAVVDVGDGALALLGDAGHDGDARRSCAGSTPIFSAK